MITINDLLKTGLVKYEIEHTSRWYLLILT